MDMEREEVNPGGANFGDFVFEVRASPCFWTLVVYVRGMVGRTGVVGSPVHPSIDRRPLATPTPYPSITLYIHRTTPWLCLWRTSPCWSCPWGRSRSACSPARAPPRRRWSCRCVSLLARWIEVCVYVFYVFVRVCVVCSYVGVRLLDESPTDPHAHRTPSPSPGSSSRRTRRTGTRTRWSRCGSTSPRARRRRTAPRASTARQVDGWMIGLGGWVMHACPLGSVPTYPPTHPFNHIH